MGIENSTGVEQPISWQLHIFDIILATILSFIVLFVYSWVQKEMKKRRVIKFWKIFLGETVRIKKEGAIISPNKLICVLHKMRSIELLVSDIYDEEKFHDYLDKIRLFEIGANNPVSDVRPKVEKLEDWLNELISKI